MPGLPTPPLTIEDGAAGWGWEGVHVGPQGGPRHPVAVAALAPPPSPPVAGGAVRSAVTKVRHPVKVIMRNPFGLKIEFYAD